MAVQSRAEYQQARKRLQEQLQERGWRIKDISPRPVIVEIASTKGPFIFFLYEDEVLGTVNSHNIIDLFLTKSEKLTRDLLQSDVFPEEEWIEEKGFTFLGSDSSISVDSAVEATPEFTWTAFGTRGQDGLAEADGIIINWAWSDAEVYTGDVEDFIGTFHQDPHPDALFNLLEGSDELVQAFIEKYEDEIERYEQ